MERIIMAMPPSDDRLKRRLENKALSYLGRFSSSEANFRHILSRFGKRKCLPKDADDEMETQFLLQLGTQIDALVARYRDCGYINDNDYALSRARHLRQKGHSHYRIRQHLQSKGIDAFTIETTMTDGELGGHEAEQDAAKRYARRRRLGVYASAKATSKPDWQNRHLASMIRAGFSYDIAKVALLSDEE
ncbi:MAG: RecX family transcriptional regulator [Proteobacteria bacterium]|nr:RecX family transcriptional regulator [Pseudomonadota bacterium]